MIFRQLLVSLGLALSLFMVGNAIAKSTTVSKSTNHTSTVAAKSHTTSQEKININTANSKTLSMIKGIGEKRAEAIIQYRKSHGKFKSINGLSKNRF